MFSGEDLAANIQQGCEGAAHEALRPPLLVLLPEGADRAV